MMAAKRIILALWLVVACALPASARTSSAPENRVWENLTTAPEMHLGQGAQVLGGHQENLSQPKEITSGCCLAAEGTGTVWDSITATQETYKGTVIPKSFELETENGSVWVHPNASDHMAEYATSMLNKGVSPGLVNMASQAQLTSLQAAVESATANGVQYNTLINAGGWELKFGAPLQPGQLPALIYAASW